VNAQKHLDALRDHVKHENLARDHRHGIAKLFQTAQQLLTRCDDVINPQPKGDDQR